MNTKRAYIVLPMRRILLFFSLVVCVVFSSLGEERMTVFLEQPDSLKITVGNVSIIDGKVYLGSAITVTGGDPEYSYLWSPADLLDNAFTANPSIDPSLEGEYMVVVSDKNNCTACAVVSWLQSGLLPEQGALSLYPIPAIDKMYLQLPILKENVTISIINTLGVILHTRMIPANETDVLQTLYFDSYEPGNYMVRILSKGYNATKVIIIK